VKGYEQGNAEFRKKKQKNPHQMQTALTPCHCRHKRCGKHTYHLSKKKCSACGFGTAGTAKLRRYAWQMKKGVRGTERRV